MFSIACILLVLVFSIEVLYFCLVNRDIEFDGVTGAVDPLSHGLYFSARGNAAHVTNLESIEQVALCAVRGG
jgi:hypothetical protein